jgi:GDP-mannose 6-dehydrogenase
MKLSIFGLGYVGAVSAGCFANLGHEVIGVDPNETKVDLINGGKSPIVEKDMDELIRNAVHDGRLRATRNVNGGVMQSDISLICVGTPSQLNGNLDLRYVRKVCEEIGAELKNKEGFHTIVIRSTMLTGSMRKVVIPALEEHSGKRAGKDFGVCINPEFLREGTAVHDFHNPPKTVIGQTDEHSGDRVAELYRHIDAPLIRTDLETAEMVKYTDNVWHAVKIAFANEIGNLCKSAGIDSHKVMDIFCQDRKLNISPSYLKPGFAFGGSCLPKDLRALAYKAKEFDLELPLLFNVLRSNRRQIERALELIMAKGNRKVGVLGFSFKAGTDDLRESPMVEVIERLIGKGYDLRLYDRNVNIASLMGANREYILNRIPHISKLMMVSMDGVLDHGETIVIGTGDPEFTSVFDKQRQGQVVLDLVRVTSRQSDCNGYEGICW